MPDSEYSGFGFMPNPGVYSTYLCGLELAELGTHEGEVKAGILGHQAQDRTQEGQEDNPRNPGLVPTESAQEHRRTAPGAVLEAARSLPILWCA